MTNFDLKFFKHEVDKMDEKTWYRRKEFPMPPGNGFRYLLDPLVNFANSINFDVVVQNPDPWSCYDGRTLGLCKKRISSSPSGMIYIHPEASSNEHVRTLCHELTHALGADRLDYGTEEITAETTAYTVCREMGLDTWNFSMPYAGYYRHCMNGRILTDDINLYATQILAGIRQTVS